MVLMVELKWEGGGSGVTFLTLLLAAVSPCWIGGFLSEAGRKQIKEPAHFSAELKGIRREGGTLVLSSLTAWFPSMG